PVALSSTVDDRAVDQPAAPARFHADQPGDRDPPGTLARHRHDGGATAAAPGTGLGWAQRLTRLVLETDPRLALRRYRFPAGQASRRQVRIACSSRSTARCCGTCTDQPMRCSRYAV